MISRIPLIVTVLAAASLASCDGGMGTVSSEEASSEEVEATSALAAPSDTEYQSDSQEARDAQEASTGASVTAVSPSPSAGGATRNIVDGICEGTACSGNDEMSGASGLDDTVSTRNDQ